MEITNLFVPGYFPKEVMHKDQLYKKEVLETILKPSKGDPEVSRFRPQADFKVSMK